MGGEGLGECEKEAEGVGEWDGSGSHNRERPNVYRLAVLLIMPRWPVKGKFSSGDKRERDSDSCISCLV